MIFTEPEMCSICYEEIIYTKSSTCSCFEPQCKTITLRCNHEFHEECMMRWLVKYEKKYCPNCKKCVYVDIFESIENVIDCNECCDEYVFLDFCKNHQEIGNEISEYSIKDDIDVYMILEYIDQLTIDYNKKIFNSVKKYIKNKKTWDYSIFKTENHIKKFQNMYNATPLSFINIFVHLTNLTKNKNGKNLYEYLTENGIKIRNIFDPYDLLLHYSKNERKFTLLEGDNLN